MASKVKSVGPGAGIALPIAFFAAVRLGSRRGHGHRRGRHRRVHRSTPEHKGAKEPERPKDFRREPHDTWCGTGSAALGLDEGFANYSAEVNTAEPDVTARLAPTSTITICTPT